MDAALNSTLGPWAPLGITGSVVIARALVNIAQWCRWAAVNSALDALLAACLSDGTKQFDRIVALLASSLATASPMAWKP